MTRTLKTILLGLMLLAGMAGGASAQTLVTSGLVRQYEASNAYQDAAKTQIANTDGQSVAAWKDMSSSAVDVTQTTTGNQPVFKIYQFGSQPGLLFGGGNVQLTSQLLTSSALTVVCVEKIYSGNTGGNNVPLISDYQSDGSGGFLFQEDNSQYVVTMAGVGEPHFGSTSTNTAVTSFELSSGALVFRANGTDISPGGYTYHSPGSGTLSIGSNPYNGGGANVCFGAILIYNRTLTTAELNQDELYLSDKYYGSVPGTVTPSAGTPQTFPLADVERWGSWAVPAGGTSAFTDYETQLAFNFTGTQAEILFSASTGVANPAYPADGFTATIDGGAVNVPIPTNFASGQNWLTLGQYLSDSPHKLVLTIANPYYQTPYGWSIDLTTPVRITGANPSCSPLLFRSAPYGKIIVFEGDSRTYGFDSSSAYGLTVGNIYPGRFRTLLNDPTWTLVNQGTYSEFGSAMLARETTDVLTQFNPANKRNVMIYWGMINDADTGATQAQMTANLRAEVAKFKQAGGHEFIALTVPYTGTNPSIQAYNADLIKNSLSYGITAVGDVNNDQAFSGHVVNSYWNADALHMTDAGQSEVANVAYAAFIHESGNLLRSRSAAGSRAGSRSGQNN